MVYEKFFYLKENPFNITPDPRFLYLSKKHQEALDLLFFGISERKGFLLLSGEVGTGKTTLCRVLLDKLNSKVKSALILNPLLSDTELIQAINEDFGLKVESSSLKEQLDALNSFLVEKAGEGGNAVVIIDEAQNLSLKALEMVRLLSNLETEKMKLLQILLVGQPELREKLKLPELRQLNQRVVVRYHLKSLNFEETKAYIFNRLTIAGGKGNIRFTSTALRSIYEASSGIPRLINIVCDRALTAAFVVGKRIIDDEIQKKAIDELDMDGTLRKDIEIPHKSGGTRSRMRQRNMAYLSILIVSLAAIFAVWWNGKQPYTTHVESNIADRSPLSPQRNMRSVDKSSPGESTPSSHEGQIVSTGPLHGKAEEHHISQSRSGLKSEIEGDKAAVAHVGNEEVSLKTNDTLVKEAVIFKGVRILVNGASHTVNDRETLEVIKGGKLKLIDAIVEGASPEDVSVNLLGFVPKKSVNTGEDRGYRVDTAKDLWVKYSVKGQGVQYPIVVKYGNKKIGEVFIKIVSSMQ